MSTCCLQGLQDLDSHLERTGCPTRSSRKFRHGTQNLLSLYPLSLIIYNIDMGDTMTLIRQKIEHELNTLDNRSMVAIYEQLRQLNSVRRVAVKRKASALNIEDVLRLTSSSTGSWSEAVCADREERL